MTLRIDVEYDAHGTTYREIATTLGAGGLFIATADPLDEGAVLVTRFRLPGGETLHEITGRVVWTHRPDDHAGRSPGMGISFADPVNGALLACELEALDEALGTRRGPQSGATG